MRSSARAFPDFIPLPADFGPEGIAVGNGTTFYTGRSRPTRVGRSWWATCERATSRRS